MKWIRRAVWTLPLLTAALFLMTYLVLELLGADCRGSVLDSGTCNELGSTQFLILLAGWVAVPLSAAIWVGWALAFGASRLAHRSDTTPH